MKISVFNVQCSFFWFLSFFYGLIIMNNNNNNNKNEMVEFSIQRKEFCFFEKKILVITTNRNIEHTHTHRLINLCWFVSIIIIIIVIIYGTIFFCFCFCFHDLNPIIVDMIYDDDDNQNCCSVGGGGGGGVAVKLSFAIMMIKIILCH